jgi:hypothetical protein
LMILQQLFCFSVACEYFIILFIYISQLLELFFSRLNITRPQTASF